MHASAHSDLAHWHHHCLEAAKIREPLGANGLLTAEHFSATGTLEAGLGGASAAEWIAGLGKGDGWNGGVAYRDRVCGLC